MALIIKGKMPTKCGECRFCNKFCDCPVCIAIPMKVEADEIFPKGCPIIGEIPDEHGRLIDADALLPKSGYDPMMFQHKYDGDHRTQYDTLMGYEILGIVEDAPTIVEANYE